MITILTAMRFLFSRWSFRHLTEPFMVSGIHHTLTTINSTCLTPDLPEQIAGITTSVTPWALAQLRQFTSWFCQELVRQSEFPMLAVVQWIRALRRCSIQ